MEFVLYFLAGPMLLSRTEEVIATNPIREIGMLRKWFFVGGLFLPTSAWADAAPGGCGGCQVAVGDPMAAWAVALLGISLTLVLRKR